MDVVSSTESDSTQPDFFQKKNTEEEAVQHSLYNHIPPLNGLPMYK